MNKNKNHPVTENRVRPVVIDFLYLDLEVCDRCIGTQTSLESALAEVSGILAKEGVEVILRKTQVTSEDQAAALGFLTSPTIRVNGRDIAMEFRESRCLSCETCADNGPITCRVWVFEGKEYTEAPKAMIIESILREVYSGGAREESFGQLREVPENIRRFFAGKVSASESPGTTVPKKGSSCCSRPEK